MTKKSKSKSSSEKKKPKSGDKSAPSKKSKTSKKKSGSKSDSSKGSSKTAEVSTSLIGNSKKHHKSKGGKPINGNSFEPSNVIGRPKLCLKMVKVLATAGAIKLKSIKEMKEHGYEVESQIIGGQESLHKSKGPRSKTMACKVINLNECTARYKITMDKYSLRVMRFIGKKPLMECFPKIFEVFLVEKVYYIFMSECGTTSLYDLVTGPHDIPPARTRKWILQLTEAIKELQKYGIAHRFIKLKHLLLESTKSENIKLVGWSKSVLFWDVAKKKALYQHKERRVRKNNFLPPEAFHRTYDPSKADIWSVGVVLVSLTSRRYPFHVRAKVKFTTQWREFVKKHPMNPIIRSLCNKIFIFDPKKRFHAREMLEHDYFKVDNKMLLNKSVRGKPLEDSKEHKKSKTGSDRAHVSKSYVSHDEKATSSHKKSSKGPSSGSSASSQAISGSVVGASKTSKTKSSIASSKPEKSSKKASKSKAKSKSKSKKTKTAPETTKPKSAISRKNAKSGIEAKKSSHMKSSEKSNSAKCKSAVEKSLSKGTKSKAEMVKTTKSSNSAKSAVESVKEGEMPKSEGKESGSGKKSASKEPEPDGSGGGPSKEKGMPSKIDGVSKQEMQAEADDAKAEADQATDEAAEPVMDEVAKESGGAKEPGEIGEGGGDSDENDKADMEAPEEAEAKGVPEELEDQGQQQVVDNAAASQVMGQTNEGGSEPPGPEGGAPPESEPNGGGPEEPPPGP